MLQHVKGVSKLLKMCLVGFQGPLFHRHIPEVNQDPGTQGSMKCAPAVVRDNMAIKIGSSTASDLPSLAQQKSGLGTSKSGFSLEKQKYDISVSVDKCTIFSIKSGPYDE